MSFFPFRGVTNFVTIAHSYVIGFTFLYIVHHSSGLAYAGAQREEVKELLEGIIGNTDVNILESSMAALSLALVFTGTCNDDIGSVILQRLMESSDADLTNTASRFMCLGECCG